MSELAVVAAGALDDVVAALGQLAVAATPLWEGRDPLGSDLAEVRPVIQKLLTEHGDLVVGAGLAVGPDGLADGSRHLEWWWSRGSGAPEALRVNLDAGAPDCYDFVTEPWFDQVVRTGDVVVAGPVVDYACTNDYALTVGHSVIHDGEVVAVAAADVPIERLESRLLPLLGATGQDIALVSGEDRVVLSTTARLWPGARLVAASGDGTPLGHGPLAAWRLLLNPGR